MTIHDWRDLGPDDLRPIYAHETARWRDRLGWDLAPALDLVEAGRRAGQVAGYVARDARGVVCGWTYFVLQRRVLQVGTLAARTVDGLRQLLDHVLRAPEAEAALEVMCFAFPERPGLESALLRRRFAVTPYGYLSRRLDDLPVACAPAAPPSYATWSPEAGPALVRLLAKAYAGEAAARCFAPHGRLDEWAQYAGGLLNGQAFGRLLDEVTFVRHEPDGSASAAVVTTALGAVTAHVAQVVVAPEARRRGAARTLLELAGEGARRAGFREITLLVAADNHAARALYEAVGFAERARFVYARRPALRKALWVEGTADVARTADRRA